MAMKGAQGRGSMPARNETCPCSGQVIVLIWKTKGPKPNGPFYSNLGVKWSKPK